MKRLLSVLTPEKPKWLLNLMIGNLPALNLRSEKTKRNKNDQSLHAWQATNFC